MKNPATCGVFYLPVDSMNNDFCWPDCSNAMVHRSAVPLLNSSVRTLVLHYSTRPKNHYRFFNRNDDTNVYFNN